MEVCVICNKREGILKVVSRGLNRILEHSVILQDEVKTRIETSTTVRVHEQCRKDYTRRRPQNVTECPIQSTHSLRSESFEFETQCFFCGESAIIDPRHPKPNIHLVKTVPTLNNVRSLANSRNDEWGETVKLRLSNVIDLVAVEGRYHQKCYVYFTRVSSNKKEDSQNSTNSFFSENHQKVQSFEKLVMYLQENEECQFTLADLVSKMQSFDQTTSVYSEKHLKRKLIDYFGSSITFAEMPGRSNVICFSGHRDKILTDKWYGDRCKLENDERKRIVLMAAKIIREDICSRTYDCTSYPSTEEMASGNPELVPETLSVLLNEIILPKYSGSNNNRPRYQLKSLALQHSIIAAVRPRSFISPIHIGLGIHLHRKFGSKLLLDILSNLGMCSTYKETVRYESCVSLTAGPKLQNNEGYVQYIFDNADYNTHTLDGYGTFHVMGGVQSVTPSTSVHSETLVPRNINLTDDSTGINKQGYIKMMWYKSPPQTGLSLITVKNISSLNLDIVPESELVTRMLDVLWGIVYSSNETTYVTKKPGWNGFMQIIHDNKSFDKSALIPLPFINNEPSNISTVYTALVHAAKESETLNQNKVFVTFDQPLCQKAYEVLLSAEPDSVLARVEVRLGGFHLLMSFLGAIGKIMGGSGLAELWNEIYAKNSVINMMNGRQYARALRAHFLTQQAITHLIFETCVEKNMIEYSLEETFTNILDGNLSPDDITECRDVAAALSAIENRKRELSNQDRTARLWVQYHELVEIVRMYIRAERSGDWRLHLHCVQLMLPYFHAAGHFNYAKTGHLYLQRMLDLQNSLPANELEKFIGKSYFTIRRSDKFWSGTWSDMIIEQYLMKSMKSSGGLTHGRGLKSDVIRKWIATIPATSKVVEAIESLCAVSSGTSPQHVELRESRMRRDLTDSHKVLEWLKVHNPFVKETALLVALHNGLVADETVNCDSARDLGLAAMESVVGLPFSEMRLKRKNVVTTLSSSKNSIKLNNDVVVINPTQLFYRMVCVVRSDEELSEILKHELAPWPTALFDEGAMRKGSGKAALKNVIETYCKPENSLPNNNELTYTIDGGNLLHKCIWQKHEKYGEIIQKYVLYVTSHFGTTNVTVVFDGYNPSIKDHERIQRGVSSECYVEENTFAVLSQESFLCNSTNKEALIKLLSKHLMAAGVTVLQAEDDADTLIVSTAIEKANQGKTSVLVGEDTDLLVLLITHADCETFMLIPEKGQRSRKVHSSKKLQEALGCMRKHLLFIHAMSGCDTTSAIYGKGKIKCFQKIKSDENMQHLVSVFHNSSSSPEDISKAGELFLVSLYGGHKDDSLNTLRYKSYLKTVGKQRLDGNFNLSSLPPTSDAARYHSYRAYLQVQIWSNVNMDPLKWGWKLVNNTFSPIQTDQDLVPKQLLHLVSCSCKKRCESRACACVKSGLKCSDMCRNCTGYGCSNHPNQIDEEADNVENLSPEEAAM